LEQVAQFEPEYIIKAMAEDREGYYRSLKTFDTFGKGWLRRNSETLEASLKMGNV